MRKTFLVILLVASISGAAEEVTVEGRGGYYDSVGVLRDMMQNHMFQMLAYLCMEPPISFSADDIRNEWVLSVKGKVRPSSFFVV